MVNTFAYLATDNIKVVHAPGRAGQDANGRPWRASRQRRDTAADGRAHFLRHGREPPATEFCRWRRKPSIVVQQAQHPTATCGAEVHVTSVEILQYPGLQWFSRAAGSSRQVASILLPTMNPQLEKLQPYPFERLASLKAGLAPPADKPHIALSIGEPRHPTPSLITESLIEHLHGLASYPTTRGVVELREAIAAWLTRRFKLPTGSMDPATQVLPVSGTREALFSFTQAVMDGQPDAVAVMPNPFYQIYEGATLLAGAQPWFTNATAGSRFLPDLDNVPATAWQRCQLLYLCSPGNPTGAVMDMHELQKVIRLADEYDFVIAADECYSEIYTDEQSPPPGLLHAAAAMGRTGYERCVVFHSLSKRSNAPGLRSGFVAGDAAILARYFLYRTYHGCTMSPAVQAASIRAWQDENHVRQNRDLYRQKFSAVLEVLQPVMDVQMPDAAFYLWAPTPGDDQRFARDLYAQQNLTVLPGSYLSRQAHGGNPGAGYVRMALVAELDSCLEAAQRIRDFLRTG